MRIYVVSQNTLNEKNIRFIELFQKLDKYSRLAKDALFVPSDLENFEMIISRALIVGTPVRTLFGTPCEALNTERCGWWRDNSPESIASVIDELYSKTNESG